MCCRFTVGAALYALLCCGLLPASSQTSVAERRQVQSKSTKEDKSSFYKRWLEEDAGWIITNEERAAFKVLSTDEEKDLFIEQFWARRDPTPDTLENEFKEEHYR